MSLPSSKRTKSDSSDHACDRNVFPSAIVLKILQFVPLSKRLHTVTFLHDDVVPEAPTPLPRGLSHRLGCLSCEYASIVREIAAHSYLTMRTDGPTSCAADELEAFYDEIAYMGDQLQCLAITLGDLNYQRRGFTLFEEFESLEALDALEIDWQRVFASCPNLRRLDLDFTPLHSTQLIKILDTASQQCPRLEALILPNEDSDSGPELLPLMDMLNRAVRRWYEHSVPGRGLRQLCVPQRVPVSVPDGPSFVELNDEFMRHVARYCPKIEYLDGYRHSFQSDEMLWCEEFICCSLDVWEEFCKSCSSLRELNWFAFPYLDPFFTIFGKYAKPQLTKLILAGGDHHNYRTNEAAIYNHQFSYSSAGLVSLFAGCPALKELEVLYVNEIEDGSRQSSMTDEVLVAIATNCMALESFEIRELVRGQEIEPMAKVTDKGVTALALLPKLYKLRVKPTQCGESGIFDLMEHAPTQGMTRVATVEIDKIGVNVEGDSRYRTFLGLLKLVVSDPEKTRGRLFDVTVRNLTYYHELTEKADDFTSECLALLKKLMKQCPHIAVVVSHNDRIIDVETFEGELSMLQSLRFVSPASSGRLRSRDTGSFEW